LNVLNSSGSEQGPVVGLFEHGNKISSSTEINNLLNRWGTVNFAMHNLHHGGSSSNWISESWVKGLWKGWLI